MHRIPVTVRGFQLLQDELKRLKQAERPKIIQAIKEARAHGDLKENAEYHAAKERQAFNEARIRDLETKVSHAHVIDVTKMQNDQSKVIFGATVTLADVITPDKMFTYKIVGEDEANIKERMISITSPIARALVGKYEDDEVLVNTPQGEVTYVILKVEYLD